MNSRIILSKNIKMDREYVNVLNFTESQMIALCEQNVVVQSNNFSFIRSNKTIQCQFSYENCLQANYIAFQNPEYANKWFFAWIDEVIYKGNNNTEIRYTIDSWSTWFSKVTTKPCFVQREHTNDDTIGNNTLPENLDVGDVVCERIVEDISLSEYYWVAVETAWIPNEGSDGTEVLDSNKGKQYSGITVYNKQIFGNKIILFRGNYETLVNLGLYILRTNSDGHIADIQNIFIVPDACIDVSKLTQVNAKVGGIDFNFYTMSNTNTVPEFTNNIEKITNFSDFQPKNNKCFVYPFNYLLVSNNVGNTNIYKYENFYGSNNAVFKTHVAIGIGCSGKLIPQNYKRMDIDNDESLPLAKYPTCSWSSDAFTNWLTQQAVNESLNMAFGLFGAGNQFASDINNANNQKTESLQNYGNTMASVNLGVNIAGQIGRQIGNFYSGALMPNIQGGRNTGDVNFLIGRNTFTFKCMRTKTENLKLIDSYFSRFGYATNIIKNPNITGRRNFNYVEIGSSEEIGYGQVPSIHMNNINNACRRGVTIWHNHENLGNYNIENNII